MSYQSDLKKKLFLSGLKSNQGNIAKTCRDLDIPRSSYHYWLDTDSVFEEQINNLKQSMIDKAEQNVFNALEQGNLKASMFVLTTIGKDRGYTTKSTIEAIQKKDVVFSFEPVKDKKALSAPNDNIIDIDYQELSKEDS